MSTHALHYAAPATATQINWSPYLAGAGIGILSWIVFVVVNNPIGVTTALSQIDRKSTRLNSSHIPLSRMPSSA